MQCLNSGNEDINAVGKEQFCHNYINGCYTVYPHRWIRSTIVRSSETVSIYSKFHDSKKYNEKIFNATFGILIRDNSEASCFTNHTLQLGVLAVFKFYYWRHLQSYSIYKYVNI